MRPLAFGSASTVLSALAGGLWLAASAPAMAQDNMVSVDWRNPEITAFVANRSTNPSLSVDAGQEAKLSKLKLPVLGFDQPTSLVANAFALEQRPPLSRNIIQDYDQPAWYPIVDLYGQLQISVVYDTLIQQTLPA